MTTEVTLEHSATLGALAKALAAAQAELDDAKKDSVNPHFKNRYASLSSVRAAITPTLSKHGLAVSQLNEPHGEAGVCIVTMLIHESGEWLKSRLFVPASKKDAQGFGSAISYARRYALGGIVNIATDDDDDAETAVKTPVANGSKPALVKAEIRITEEEADVANLFRTAKTTDDISKAEVEAARVVQAGKADRTRLLALRKDAISRLGAGPS